MALNVEQSETFVAWLAEMKDVSAQAHISERIVRLAHGSFGDVKPVGEGVWEMRIHRGPGYRIYYVRRGERIVLLLCGGDKGSQDRDIRRAKKMAEEI